MKYWSVAPEWRGETVFVVCGGTSVEAHLDGAGLLACLAGRRVVVINSSWARAPFADLLFFGDSRWWNEHRKPLASFAGRIATVSAAARGDRLLKLRRVIAPPSFAPEPDRAAMRHTSLTATLNVLAHLLLDAGTVVLLGADMGPGPGGRTHHHPPHKWRGALGHYAKKLAELEQTVAPLKARNIEVLNASPISRITWWPKVSLDAVLAGSTPNPPLGDGPRQAGAKR